MQQQVWDAAQDGAYAQPAQALHGDPAVAPQHAAAADQQMPALHQRGGARHRSMHIGKIDIPYFHGNEQDDVLLWLQHFQKVVAISGWSNEEAITFAELHMRDKAQQWFVGLDRSSLPTFSALCNLLVARFGEGKTMLMTRLDHRKQQVDEPVRDYIDAMRLLFAKTEYPAEGQAQKFMAGLHSNLRSRVQNCMPRTLDAAIEAALYMEDMDIAPKPVAAASSGKGSAAAQVS